MCKSFQVNLGFQGFKILGCCWTSCTYFFFQLVIPHLLQLFRRMKIQHFFCSETPERWILFNCSSAWGWLDKDCTSIFLWIILLRHHYISSNWLLNHWRVSITNLVFHVCCIWSFVTKPTAILTSCTNEKYAQALEFQLLEISILILHATMSLEPLQIKHIWSDNFQNLAWAFPFVLFFRHLASLWLSSAFRHRQGMPKI